MTTTSEQDSAGREVRTSVMLMAELDRAHEPMARRRVINLSVHGVCIADPDGMTVGERVVVSLGSIERLCATVVWARPGHAGLRFDGGIDIEAARTRSPRSEAAAAVSSSGWIGSLNDPYRQHHRRRFD